MTPPLPVDVLPILINGGIDFPPIQIAEITPPPIAAPVPVVAPVTVVAAPVRYVAPVYPRKQDRN